MLSVGHKQLSEPGWNVDQKKVVWTAWFPWNRPKDLYVDPYLLCFFSFSTTSCQALKGGQNMEGKVRGKKKRSNLPVLLLGWSKETTQWKMIFINTWIFSMWWNPSPLRIPTTVPKWLASARVSEANLSTRNTGVWDQQPSGQQVRQESCCCHSSSAFAN